MASWGKLASRLAAVAMTDSNSKLLSDLEVNSEILDLIQDEFLMTLRKTQSGPSHSTFHIYSFIEGRAVTGVRGFNSKVCIAETILCIPLEHPELIATGC